MSGKGNIFLQGMFIGFLTLWAISLRAEVVTFVDTHAHLEHTMGVANFPGAAKAALAEMDEKAISRSLLMPPPQSPHSSSRYDYEDLLPIVKANPQKFSFLGGGGSLNVLIQDTPPDQVTDDIKKKFRARAESILAAGALGFGEITAEHFSLPAMGSRHPYESVPGDHPLLLLLADIAAEHNVPIDVHFDVSPEDRPLPPTLRSPPNPPTLHENLQAFERLLDHNPRAKIVWAHVGQDPGHARTVQLCRQMLARHPNLYMSFRTGKRGPQPLLPIAEDGTLKKPWLALIRDFPDRFVLGSDQFYVPPSMDRRTFEGGLDTLRDLLNGLPPDLAKKVAFENAQAIYNLPR